MDLRCAYLGDVDPFILQRRIEISIFSFSMFGLMQR